MALHPGEAGHDEKFEEKAAASEEKRQGCADMSARNRRADLRMSDIHRAAKKAVPDSPLAGYCTTDKPIQGDGLVARRPGLLGPVEDTNPEILKFLENTNNIREAGNMVGQTQPMSYKTTMLEPAGFDKNTPSSLKQLRWEIYDLIERYEGDYGRTISMTLRSEIEELFKKYTHS